MNYFVRNILYELDAYRVCTPRTEWTSIDPIEANNENAAGIMTQYRFDVLPIEASKTHTVKEIFETTKRNAYSKETIVRRYISVDDTLPANTLISTIIKEFVRSKRLFYMLILEASIAGIITLSDFNSRLVRGWLFSLLCEYETSLSDLVKKNMAEETIIKEIKDSKNGGESISRYTKDMQNGIDNHICEYLYLATITNIIAKYGLYAELGYTSRNEFEELNSINEIRLAVMHPVKSIITDETSLNRLSERLNKLYDVLFRLRNH